MATIECPRCGFSSPPGFAFCGGCGAKLSAPNGEKQATGQRRSVVVLFIDLKGYTSLSETLDAEEVHELMNRWFAGLTRIVQTQGGHVDKYIGDCMMALFGAPVAHEDDPERAILAALAMQDWTREFASSLGDGKNHVTARVGLHLGEVIAGEVGGENRFDYSVMGDTVNVASRLESSADPGTVQVSEKIWARTKHAFSFDGPRHLELKGKSKPVPAYVLVGPRESEEPALGIDGAVSPLVGRSSELEELLTEIEACRKGGRAISLIAETGVGKSRLLRELRSVLPQDMRWWEVTCQPRHSGTPYGAVRALLRQVDEELDFLEEQPQWLPFLQPLLAGDSSAAESLGASPQEGRQLLHRAILWLVDRLTRRVPRVLVVDDFHWSDKASRSVFDELYRATATVPICIVLAHRPGHAAPWAEDGATGEDKSRWKSLHVAPLEKSHCSQLLEEMLPGLSWSAPIREKVLERSAGNPLYLEETIRALMEAEVLVERDGEWFLSDDRDVPIPDTLGSLLMSRIDRLSEPARRWLTMASVQRGDISRTLIDSLNVEDESHSEHSIQELIDARLLEPSDTKGILRFVHPMIRGVAYESLLHRDRRALHARVGRRLETPTEGIPSATLEELALHFGKSDDHPRAVKYALSAGERALDLCETQSALEHFELALHRRKKLEATSARVAERRARTFLCELYLSTGRFEEAIEHGELARDLSVECSPAERARVFRLLGLVRARQGDPDSAEPWFSEALDILDAGNGTIECNEERTRVLLDRAYASYRLGDYRSAATHAEAGLDSATRSGNGREQAKAMRLKSQVLWALGSHEGLEEVLQKSIALCESNRDPAGSASAWNMLGNLARDQGAYHSAKDHYRRAVDLWDRIGHVTMKAGGLNNLAVLLMGQGEMDEAQNLYEECLEIARSHNDHFTLAMAHANLGHLSLEMNELDRARNHLGSGLERSRERGFSDLTAYLLCGLGSCGLAQGEPEEAKSCFREAQELAESMGQQHLLAHALRGSGEVAALEGNAERAEEQLSEALELYRSVGRAQEAGRTSYQLAKLLSESAPGRARQFLSDAIEVFQEVRAHADLERAEQLKAVLNSP